jgi:superfamily II DNA or RNA helicase
MSIAPDDLSAILGQLKDFQRHTVDYVFRRMSLDRTPARRFLVADEVGLGKTMVARGVIARALHHLSDKVDRIDVVYVCSNATIAEQNINRLNVLGLDHVAFATRLTMLPVQLGRLAANRRLRMAA